jgi:predicted nucleic acid-binding protein
MKLLDVNILVEVHREDAIHHDEVKAWLEEVLEEPAGVAVSELVLSGFLRVVTHPKVFR